MCIRDRPYLETALPAMFLQYGVASAVARYRKYMIVLGPVSYTHLDVYKRQNTYL